MLKPGKRNGFHYLLFVLFILLELLEPGSLVPYFEVSEHSGKDYLLVHMSFFTKQGRNQYSSLIIELTLLSARNEAPQEGSMIGVYLRKMQRFGFYLVPLLGWISDKTSTVLGDNQCVGIMLLEDFSELRVYSEAPFGVEPCG